MKTFSLMAPQIDPEWLRRVRGARHEARIHHCGVTLEGVHLRFLAPDEDCPEDGTVMVVWLERNFLCATKTEFGDAAPMASLEPEMAAHN